MRCIQVAAPDGMFLVGRTYIPTHNSSLGRLGLLTHSTAGFIDPGFTGHITLELSNVANLPITLWPGMKIGQLCLFRLSTPAERPYGSQGVGSRYQGQRGPTASRAHLNFHRVDTRRRLNRPGASGTLGPAMDVRPDTAARTESPGCRPCVRRRPVARPADAPAGRAGRADGRSRRLRRRPRTAGDG